jgi:hypothetical protein
LEHVHSFESCSQVLAETSRLFAEPEGWFFRILNQTILRLIDEPDMFLGVNEAVLSPVLERASLAGIQGIAAIRLGDAEQLKAAAQELSDIRPETSEAFDENAEFAPDSNPDTDPP